MIIESIEMENFKSHSNTRVEFDTGISIIMGENGAGKSSILEAVSFALFKQYSGRKIDQLIKNGGGKMSVTLTFVVNGRKYRIKRQRTKSGSRATLEILDGESFIPLVSQEKPVNEEVKKLLEMDGDLFLNAVYVRQGEIADLIEKTSSEKKQMIGKLLGIDSLEKAWKNMLPLINSYENRKENLKGRLDSMEGLKENLASKKDEKVSIGNEIQSLDLKIDESSKKLDLIEKEKQSLDHKREQFNNLKSRIDSKTEVLDQIKDRMNQTRGELNDIKVKEAKILDMEPEVRRLDDLYRLRDTLQKLKHAQEEEKRIKMVLNNINEFKNVLDENYKLYKDYLALNSEIAFLEDKKREFEGSKAVMEQLKTRRSQLDHKVTAITEKIEEQFEAVNRILGTDIASIRELDEHITSVKLSTEKKIEELKEKISNIQQDVKNLQIQNEKLERLIMELKTVENKCPVCKSDINESKRMELIGNYSGEMESNELLVTDLDKELKSLKSQETVLNQKYMEVQTINMDLLREHSKALEEAKNDFNKVDMDLREVESKVLVFENITADIEKKKMIQNKLKGNYEDYISAKGALESLGSFDEKEKDLERVQSEIKSLKEIYDELFKRDPSLREKMEFKEEDIEKEISIVEDLKNEYNRLLGIVSRKESLLKSLEVLREEERRVSDELRDLKGKIEDLAYREDLHENIQMLLYNSNQELNDLKGQKNELKGKMAMISSRITELESELESYKNYEKELKKIKDFIKLLNYIRDLYGKDGIQKDLRNISRPLIEQNTREFFEKFNFEYSDIKLDEDYNITIYGPAGKNSLDMISGGEKIAVALALRLGITQTLSGGNLELIMLDEPTIHLDSYRRQELIELLKRMSVIPQMIIVTHETDLEEAADNILRVKKEDGDSFVLNS